MPHDKMPADAVAQAQRFFQIYPVANFRLREFRQPQSLGHEFNRKISTGCFNHGQANAVASDAVSYVHATQKFAGLNGKLNSAAFSFNLFKLAHFFHDAGEHKIILTPLLKGFKLL